MQITGTIHIKKCKTCGIEKDLSEFNKRKQRGRKDSYRTECKDCIKIYKSNYYEENKIIISEKQRKYYVDNKDVMLLRKAEYRKSNVEICKAAVKRHYRSNTEDYITRASKWNKENKGRRSEICRKSHLKNPHIKTANTAKRRATKKDATPKWSETDKIKLVYKKAKELSLLLGVDIQVDHVIPLQSKTVCGLHVWSNLQLLERSLNLTKGNRYD